MKLFKKGIFYLGHTFNYITTKQLLKVNFKDTIVFGSKTCSLFEIITAFDDWIKCT